LRSKKLLKGKHTIFANKNHEISKYMKYEMLL